LKPVPKRLADVEVVMTRETKIGLLVGLAFCIMIGILMSNYMASATEPVAAPLLNTASNVRDSVSSPVSDPPPITIVTQTVSPREPMNLPSDPTVSRPTQSIVQIGGPAEGAPIQIRQTASRSALPAQVQQSNPNPAAVDNNPPGPPATPGSLQQVAQAQGEPIVGVSDSAANGVRKYSAEPGDTLSRLAGRFLGANTKANRDIILKANPSLQSDPNRIIVGRTYLIPGSAAAQPTPPAVAAADPATPAPQPQQPSPTASQPQYWYTVKENDSLWSIAADQLGDGGAWTAIKELNADVLKGSDTVHPDMKLRLPAKPLASAQ
jgi:nucleoid-associated protein YgaU